MLSGNSSVRSHLDIGLELLKIHCVVLRFGICVVYESGVQSNVVWTSSEVLKSDSDLTISLSTVDVELEICFIGALMALAFRIRDSFY
jgi:hypothetical protein